MTEPVKITVLATTRFKPVRAIYFAAIQVAVIGVGVAVESAAMQWSGFLFLAFLFGLNCMVLIVQNVEKNKPLSIQEARKRMDEIEREQSQ